MSPVLRFATWFGQRSRWLLVTAGAIALIVPACAADPSDAPGSGPADGAQLYAANCAVCHGAELQGTLTGPSPLSIVYEPSQLADDAFRVAVRDGAPQRLWGFGAMAPIAGLDDAEIAAIIAYVREAQQREGFEPYPPD